MLPLTERLIQAYLRRDAIPVILRAKLASKSSTEKLFLLTAVLEELNNLKFQQHIYGHAVIAK